MNDSRGTGRRPAGRGKEGTSKTEMKRKLLSLAAFLLLFTFSFQQIGSAAPFPYSIPFPSIQILDLRFKISDSTDITKMGSSLDI